MSNATAITKQMVGAQVVMGTLKAGEQYRDRSGFNQGTANLVQNVVGGTLLGPSEALGGAILGSLNKSQFCSFGESNNTSIFNKMG